MSQSNKNIYKSLRTQGVESNRATQLSKTMNSNSAIKRGLEELFYNRWVRELKRLDSSEDPKQIAARAKAIREVAADLGISLKDLLDKK